MAVAGITVEVVIITGADITMDMAITAAADITMDMVIMAAVTVMDMDTVMGGIIMEAMADTVGMETNGMDLTITAVGGGEQAAYFLSD